MKLVEQEIPRVQRLAPPARPAYGKENPIWRIVEQVEAVDLAAEREAYLADSLQYLFPIAELALYGPSGTQWQDADPRAQDNKEDFQKQNIRDLKLTGLTLARGYARAGGWTGAMLHLAYAPPDGSPLAGSAGFPSSRALRVVLRVGNRPTAETLLLPYNEATGRYEVELWGYRLPDLRHYLGEKGRVSFDAGRLLGRPDLVTGEFEAFHGPGFDRLRDLASERNDSVRMLKVEPGHAMHPLLPLRIELAFSDPAGQVWDSRGGENYAYEFNMALRGWRHHLASGRSANPHGGVGTLEFRNLFSNYFGHEADRRAVPDADPVPELGRVVQPWNFDAHGAKSPASRQENFLAVDYMDLHLLRPGCGIGIHRHRDNQEAFMLLAGKALMVTGDWCEWPRRQRAFEVRTMLPHDIVLIKGGHLHALLNVLDENITLFMFGGYD